MLSNLNKINFKETGYSPFGKDPLSINILPVDVILRLISFLPIDNLPIVSLTSRLWRQVAKVTYWDKIFTFTEYLVQPKTTLLTTAVKRLEQSDPAQLIEFMERCHKLNITNQVNFISNIIRSPYPNRDPKFENLLIKLFKNVSCPIACKMKIIDFVKSMGMPVFAQLQWKGDPLKQGLHPKMRPFKLEIVSSQHALNIHVHKNHTFKRGELVAIIEKVGFQGKSTLYYGRILEKVKNTWRIYLECSNSGSYAFFTLKSPEEIGKFSQDTDLSYF